MITININFNKRKCRINEVRETCQHVRILISFEKTVKGLMSVRINSGERKYYKRETHFRLSS